MLLFYIIFGNRNSLYHALGSNVPSARRPGQRFHFLQCRGSSPSLRFVNRHGGTLRRSGWVTFTKTYSRGSDRYLAFTSNFCDNYSHPASLYLTPPRPRPTRPHVPYLMSSSPSSRVPKSPHTRPDVPVPLLYTASLSWSYTATSVQTKQGRPCSLRLEKVESVVQ